MDIYSNGNVTGDDCMHEDYVTDDQLSQASEYVQANDVLDDTLGDSYSAIGTAAAKPKKPKGRPRKKPLDKRVTSVPSNRNKRPRTEKASPSQTSRDYEFEEAGIHSAMNSKMNVMVDQLIESAKQTFNAKINKITSEIEQRFAAKLDTLIEEKLNAHTSRIDDRVEAIAGTLGSYQTAMNQNAADILDLKQSSLNDASIHARILSLEKEVADLKNKTPTDARFEQLENRINDHRTETTASISQVNRHVEKVETHSRKLNLVFEGVPEKEGENCKAIVESLIRRSMNINLTIDIAHRLKKSKLSEPAGLIARFKTVADKSRVIQNGAALKDQHIYLRSDLPYVTTQRRNYLAKSLPDARKSDPNARLAQDKIVIHGRYYDMDNIHTANLKDSRHCQTTDGQVRFYGYLSPLSNFHKCDIRLNGTKFCNAEQAYHFLKAKRVQAHQVAAEILMEPNPATIKKIARRVKVQSAAFTNNDDIDIMKRVVTEKFTQNKYLAEYLLSTNDRVLLECNPHDVFYSTGSPIHDQNLDQLSYRGRNMLGKLLQEVRECLSK